MRLLKTIVLLLLLVASVNVNANTCSYKEQTILNNDFSNLKITYEVLSDNEINILIYNISENLYITFVNHDTNLEESIYYSDTTNGRYSFIRNTNEIEEYQFKVRANMSNCYGNILTTKKIIKPKYNNYSNLEICKNEKLSNHSYCQKFITKEIKISEEEVKKTLEDFVDVHVGVAIVDTPEKNKIPLSTIIKYSLIGLGVAAIITILLLIKKKRGEL